MLVQCILTLQKAFTHGEIDFENKSTEHCNLNKKTVFIVSFEALNNVCDLFRKREREK